MSKLLAQYPFVQGVARVVQQDEGGLVIGLDIDEADATDFEMVGRRGDWAFVRFANLEPDARAIG